MIELIEGIGLAGAGIGVLKLFFSRKTATRQKLTTERKSDTRLYGVRGGVWVKEPNGSNHPFQNLLEQELSRRGMALYNLRREPTEILLKNGEWDEKIATGPLDVAVIGRIIVQVREEEVSRYVSVQHVHTPTGFFFFQLDPSHPDYREPNKNNGYLGKTYFPPDTSIYREGDGEFTRRRELEKNVDIIKHETLMLDVRFYGPDGLIRGGCTISLPVNGEDSLKILVQQTTDELAAVAKLSLAANQTSQAEMELDTYKLPNSEEQINRTYHK